MGTGLALECQGFREGNSYANHRMAFIAGLDAGVWHLALECHDLALECQP